MTQLPEHIPTISQQTRLFLGSCLLGIPIGFLLDGFRILRSLLPHRYIAVFIEDALFVSSSIFLVLCYSATFGDSRLRIYCVIGAMLGLLLYLLTIGVLTMRITQKIRKIAQNMCMIFKSHIVRMRAVFVKAYENRKKA